MRYILILFIPMFSLEGFSQQTDYLRPHYQDYDAASMTYGEIHPFSSNLVTSDFGPRRIPAYDWHSGIDYTCGNCENDLAISCLDGWFYYGESSGGLRHVIIDGSSDLAYLHLFSSLKAGKCQVLGMKDKPNQKVVVINYNGVVLAFAAITGKVLYNGIYYDVENYINASQPLGPVGGSGGYPVHLHIEELPDGGKTISDDKISKNPLQTLLYDVPDYSELSLNYSKTNDLNNVNEGINLKYPGTLFNSILIRPTYPNAIGHGRAFATINDVNKVSLYLRNTTLNGSWELISGPNYKSEFKLGGILGEATYPDKIRGPGFGSFKSTGIYPNAYAGSQPKEYDDFIYCDFFHRIHKDDQMKGNKSMLTSNCPGDSRYLDGNYEFKSTLQSIGGTITEGTTYNSTIDNFQPYIQSVIVLIDGINIYSASWECNKNGPEFSGYECKSTSLSPQSFITINVTSSEPLTFLNGKIVEFPGSFISFNSQGGLNWTATFQNNNYLKDGDKGHLQFAGTDFNGNHLLDMRAMAGGKITSKLPIPIPIHENATTWKPTRKGGDYDDVHEFCFVKCSKLWNGGNSNDFHFQDCLSSSDLNLTYEIESFTGAGDGWIHLDISGGFPPYFVSWTDDAGNLIKEGLNEYDLTDLIAGTYCYSIVDDHCCELNSCITLCPYITLSVTKGLTHPTACKLNDGTIRIVNSKANGGIEPYDYHLEDIYGNRIPIDPNSGKYEELFAGRYFYIATDANGCSASYAIELVSPEDFYTSSEVTKSCNGNDGSIAIGAFSNDFPDDTYTFSWSTGFEENDVTESMITQLTAGKYCVTITSNTTQCTKEDCFEVKGTGKALELKYAARIPCPNQRNGEIQLTVNGGSKPYTYKWSNNDFRSHTSNLGAGEYCVTVTDDCHNTLKKCVNISDVLSVNLNIEYKCPKNVNVYSGASGGNPPFTYKWSNGASTKDLIEVPIGPIYKVIVTDKFGCTVSNEINTNPIELLNPVKPCKGFWDGAMTIKINNPKNEMVNVSYDYKPCDDCSVLYKIHDDHSNPVLFTLNDLAGNKEYHFNVRIGNCFFDIYFTLGEEVLTEEFKRFDESNGTPTCVYDLVCKENRIKDGKHKDPILTHTGGNCQRFIFKKCASVEVRCEGNPGVVKTIPGKVVHMRRLEVIKYAQDLGLDPSSLSGNFCDHMWICHDDPFCIVAKATGELGGKFKGIEKDGDCYKVKCRSFFGLIKQDYRICGQDFIPEAFFPYYRNDRIYENPGGKPKPKPNDCTPITLNFTDVLECWPKLVNDDGSKFYDSELAKMIISYRTRRERYCAWVTYCMEDYSIIKTNINDFECEDFHPPINVGDWWLSSTCDPITYNGNEIVFCECNDPEIIKKTGRCLEPKLLPKKCTITLKNTEDPKAIQFLPFQNGNIYFTRFSTLYQPEGFTTINGIYKDAFGNSYYQKYEPGELFNKLENFEGAIFAHQNAKHNRINLIINGSSANSFEIYSGDYNAIDFNSISSDQNLKFISCNPFENGFTAVGEYSGHLRLNGEELGNSISNSLFIVYRNDVTNVTTLSMLSGVNLLTKNDKNSNTFLLKRTSAFEPVLLNQNEIDLDNTMNIILMRVNDNGGIDFKPLMDIQNDVNIISCKESSDGLNDYVFGIAKGTIHIGNAIVNLPNQEQFILFKWSQNQLVWYRNFSQAGIDIQNICMENMGNRGIALGLNVGVISSLFKSDPTYLNSISSDIVILNYDLDGNLVYQNRFGSIYDDEILKELYYSEENVLYLGGDIIGTSSIRPIGDLDLIKTETIQNAAFISYINFNSTATNETARNQANEITENTKLAILRLTPNPVNDQLKVEYNYEGLDKVGIEVLDLTGKLVNTNPHFNKNTIIFDTNKLPSGMYIVKLKDKSGHIDMKRFVKI